MSSEQSIPTESVSEFSLTNETDVTTTVHSTSFLQRLFKRDGRRFNKYIQTSTIHGLGNIFVGKSKIRRFLWLVIVLGAVIGCTHNIIDRIVYLASGPTVTNVSILEPSSIKFPAVTLCNLNLIKRSFLESASMDEKLYKLIKKALYAQGIITNEECNEQFNHLEAEHDRVGQNLSFPDLLWYGRHTAEEMIFTCRFADKNCDASNFVPSLTPTGGVCYTFNSRKEKQKRMSNGTGIRFALSLVVYVQQHEYNAGYNLDAGIKIAIHPRSEPPQPDELGIAVAPGKNAFISMRQTSVENKSSKRKCREDTDTKTFNFLQKEFPYSLPACQIDCLRTMIAKKCNCLGASSQEMPPDSKFNDLNNCTSSINDVCCQLQQLSDISACDCPEACSKTFYSTGISYSAFPAKYAVDELSRRISNNSFINVSSSISSLQENFLGINIYFETLAIVQETTSNAYDIIALLSDIGGQLALFLGASVISVLEILTWTFDEVKDRCCGISERKIAHKFKASFRKRKKASTRKAILREYNVNDGELYQMDDYQNFDK